MKLRLSLLIAGGLLLKGCGTLTALTGGFGDPILNDPGYVYGGAAADLEIAQYSFGLSLIDLPLSLAADTVLLPLTIPMEVSLRKDVRRRQQERQQEERAYELAQIAYLDNCARLIASGPVNPSDAYMLYSRYDDFSDPNRWPPRMREESLRWLRQSAEAGGRYAQELLFQMAFRDGNKVEAYAWATTFLTPGEVDARNTDGQAATHRMQARLEGLKSGMSPDELKAADELARHHGRSYVGRVPRSPERIDLGYSRAIICDGIPAPVKGQPGKTSADGIFTHDAP